MDNYALDIKYGLQTSDTTQYHHAVLNLKKKNETRQETI